jgi:hypothetical protein
LKPQGHFLLAAKRLTAALHATQKSSNSAERKKKRAVEREEKTHATSFSGPLKDIDACRA